MDAFLHYYDLKDDFNSMIVRLKAMPDLSFDSLKGIFQFYDSPIKRWSSSDTKIATVSKFQFYDSPIKRAREIYPLNLH